MTTTIAEETKLDADDVQSTLCVSLVVPDLECGDTWEMLAPLGAFVEGDPDDDDDDDDDFFSDDDDDRDDNDDDEDNDLDA